MKSRIITIFAVTLFLVPQITFAQTSFNLGKLLCGADRKQDQETGCFSTSCDNAKVEYEACRQSFYLKQQNEILKQGTQKQQVTTSTINNDQKIKDLELRNADIQRINNQKTDLVTQLIQNQEKTAHKIEKLNFINTILIVILVIVVCAFFVEKIMKRKGMLKDKMEQ